MQESCLWEISGAKGLAQEITTWKGCGGQTCSSERGLGKVGMNSTSVVEDKKGGLGDGAQTK